MVVADDLRIVFCFDKDSHVLVATSNISFNSRAEVNVVWDAVGVFALVRSRTKRHGEKITQRVLLLRAGSTQRQPEVNMLQHKGIGCLSTGRRVSFCHHVENNLCAIKIDDCRPDNFVYTLCINRCAKRSTCWRTTCAITSFRHHRSMGG